MRPVSAIWRSLWVIVIAWLLLTAAPGMGFIRAQDDTSTETNSEVTSADAPADEPAEEAPPEEPAEEESSDNPVETPTEASEIPPTETSTPTEAPTAEATPAVTEVINTPESTETAPPPAETDTPIATAIPLPDEPTLALFAETSFDDGDLSAWRLGAGWALVSSEDGQALRIENATGAVQLVQTGLEDVAVEARFLSKNGTAQLLARQSENGAYSASLSPDGGVELARAGSPLASVTVTPSEDGQWRTLRLSIMDGVLRVSIDGEQVIGMIDDAPLPPGAVSVAGVFAPDVSSDLIVDDVRVWLAEGETPPEPSEVPIAQEDTSAEPEITPEATALIPDDRVIVVPEVVTLDATPEVTPDATVEPQDEEVTAQSGPAAPTLTSPTAGATVTSGRPTFKWGSSSGANRYRLEVSADDFTTLIAVCETTSLQCTLASSMFTAPYVALVQGAYEWRVKARNAALEWGDFGEERAVTVDLAKTPANNATVTTGRPTFSWYSMSGAANYRLQIDDDADFLSTLLDKSTLTGTSYALSSAEVLQQETYYWRVGTLDPQTSDWEYSITRTFTVNLLKSPAAGAATIDTTPTFSWYSMSSAACYRLVIYDEDHTNPDIVYQTTSTSFTVPGGSVLPLDRYLWRIDVDAAPPCDNTWTVSPFTRLLIVSPTFPPKPTLTSPPSGTITNDNETVLDWTITPTGGTPYTYEIQIDNSSSFTNPITVTDVVSDTAYDPAVEGALPDGKLYWRVRTLNYLGAPSSWSSSRYLTVDTVDPVVPVLRDPADNAITTDNTPRLRWFAADGASSYEVRLGTKNGGTCALTDANLVKTTSSLEFTPSGALLFTTYCWQVQALDQAENESGWSTAWTLVINSPSGAAPVLNRNATSTVVLSWTPISWALGYEIQIAANSSFSGATTYTVSDGNAFTFTTPTLPDGNYWWRIRAKKTSTSWSSWSKTATFSVDA